MAVKAVYLADKSALARLSYPAVERRLGPLLVEGLVATCPIIDLELLYSAHSLRDYEQILAERQAMPGSLVDAQITKRAMEIQHALARRGHHRLPIPDILISAVADLNGLTVLHYDADYDHIADAAGCAAEWVAPRGSLEKP